MNLFSRLRPLLHALPPETAHALGIAALEGRLLFEPRPPHYSELETNILGLHFANPIGVAAGFDKNARAIDGLLAQGFGFVEAGTVTPKPQPGNPAPRLFRLPEDEAVINRLGFNNDGLAAFVRNFARRKRAMGVAGANIGKNKDAADAIADYTAGLSAVHAVADYVTVNISSPNTPGLRDLQKREALAGLLAALAEARKECEARDGKRTPLLVKIAPDLEGGEKETIAELALAHGIDGMVISNTTVARPEQLKSPLAAEQGGLSGRPLFAPSTALIADMYRLTGGRLALIGVGGITSADDAYAKFRAGASLVQLYTAMVYHGFGLARELCDGLAALLARDGFSQVGEAVGVDCGRTTDGGRR